MFKKTLIASALALASLASFAADYYVVTPAPGKESTANIVVTLNAASLPAAKVNSAYSYDLNQALQVTGDTAYDSTGVSWTLANGTTPPPGLSLGSNGVVSGTPTTKNTNGQSFDVVATYKTKTGQQAYTIVVNGVELQVLQITSGTGHTCAITTTGGAKCWGLNSNGQLGNGTNSASYLPTDVAGLTSGVSSISALGYSTCAVTSSGAAKCWGYNVMGQLGDNTTIDKTVPVTVSGLSSGVASISVSPGNFTCAVTTSGGAKCWGWNNYGQLGNNSVTTSRVPTDVVGLSSGVSSITTGESHACAITTSGATKCWGLNGHGQLGNNTYTSSSVPVDVSGLSSTLSISAGAKHTCAITAAGAAKCWGHGAYGQIGSTSSGTRNPLPLAVSGLSSGVASIKAGSYHTCAVSTSGAAKCWGSNSFGQVGNNSTTNSTTPVSVIGLSSGVSSISTGTDSTCAVKSDGTALCWGDNSSGQVGNNAMTYDGVLTPTAVNSQ